MISFEPLRILLVKRNIKKMDFMETCKITPATAAKLWKDGNVNTETLDRICTHLEVQPSDIIEHKKEQEG